MRTTSVMKIDQPATEASLSSALPLTAMELDRPRPGYMIFDHSECVTQATSNLRAVLRLHCDLPLQGAGVLNLLEIAIGPEKMSSLGVAEWFDRRTALTSQEDAPPLLLVTATDARTVRGSLVALGQEYWIAIFEDVTETLDPKCGMTIAADQDLVTGVDNRSFFEHSLDRTLARLAAGEIVEAAVFFLDLDRFKVVNDSLGHAMGDKLLRLVSERLRTVLLDSDILARLGGDEFAILIDRSCGKSVTSALAQQVIDIIQRPCLIEGEVIHVGVSIGIAVAPGDGMVRADLLKNADLALYHSKSAGRGVFHFFKPAMAEKVLRRRALERDLRKALLLRQFELHYQPQIDVANQQIIGLEGLLRWRHPQRGLMLPGEFLAIAEELRLAVPIGEWVLRTACREATLWPGSVTVAVNISSLQFEMKTFADLVEQALTSVKLPGNRLEIEVTEDILLRDAETVRGTLNDLRALGVRVAIDSFGTGVASLSQLVNFPFDKIKIDRSLVDMHHDGAKHRAIVRAICALGQGLGISTQAEGVETTEQLADVQSEGCDSIQGFYYREAVPANRLMDVFSTFSALASPGTSKGPA